MSSKHGENYIPIFGRGKDIKVKSSEEIKRLILSSYEVKEELAIIAKEKAKQYEGHL